MFHEFRILRYADYLTMRFTLKRELFSLFFFLEFSLVFREQNRVKINNKLTKQYYEKYLGQFNGSTVFDEIDLNQ